MFDTECALGSTDVSFFTYFIFFGSEGESKSVSMSLLDNELVLLFKLCSLLICCWWSAIMGIPGCPGSLSFLCLRFQQSGLTFIRSSAISLAERANSSRFSSDSSRQRSPNNLLIALLLIKKYEDVRARILRIAVA